MADKHVVVIGAGIIGITSAWFLRQQGFAVTVVEEQAGPALVTSAGNAGIVAPGYVTPFAAPGVPLKVFKQLFKSESAFMFRPTLDIEQWRWLKLWLGECDAQRYRINKMRMQRIALYSKQQLHILAQQLNIDYQRTAGYFLIFRSEKDRALADAGRQLLLETGTTHQLLNASELLALEPSLAPSQAAGVPINGGLLLPDDEAGNCPLFARRLADHAQVQGVSFRYLSSVTALVNQDNTCTGVRLSTGEVIQADAVVVCAASNSPALLRSVGVPRLNIPLYPIKGYSATYEIPIDRLALMPRYSMMDDQYKTAITPFVGADQVPRLRIAGTAELGSRLLTLNENSSAVSTLKKMGRDWCPQVIEGLTPKLWVGARPMMPDGPPLIGKTPVAGLYLNTGHGSTGWAMSVGSGKAVADVVAGKLPEIDLDGLGLSRY